MSIVNDINIAVKNVLEDNIDINESVIKHASKLPLEGIKRVIEKVNVGKFLHLMKSGNDRTTEFSVADPEVIFKKLGNKSFEKTSVSKTHYDNSLEFYTNDYMYKKAQDDKFRAIEKANDLKCKITDENIINTYLRNELEKKALNNKKKDFIKQAFARLQSITVDLYQDFLREKNKYNQKELGNVLNDLYNTHMDKLACIPFINVIKNKSGLNLNFTKKEIVDDRKELYKIGSQLIECLNSYNDLYKYAEEDDEEGGKRNKRGGGGSSIKGLSDLISSSFGLPSKLLGKAIETRVTTTEKELAKGKPSKTDKNLMALNFKNNISNLIHGDEILKDKDPKEVLDYFMTITKIAPNVAAFQPKIVASFLRQVTSQGMLGPYEAKNLAELENALYGEPKVTKGGK